MAASIEPFCVGISWIERIKIVQQNMKAAQDRQKSYADQRRKPLEFEKEDKVFLKIPPIKEV